MVSKARQKMEKLGHKNVGASKPGVKGEPGPPTLLVPPPRIRA